MLCRYLNGRGYKRYGCNAQYKYPYKSNDKINPCPILCKGSKIYPGRIRYWVMKLFQEKRLFTIKRLFYDSKNPNSANSPMLRDNFRFICLNNDIYNEFIKKNTLELFL